MKQNILKNLENYPYYKILKIPNQKDNELKEKFYSSLHKYFNVALIENGPRNPFIIQNDFLDQLNDDSRFLLLGEGRPQKMGWIFLSPKYQFKKNKVFNEINEVRGQSEDRIDVPLN